MIDLSLLQDFITETGEHLEEMETDLLQLEVDPDNQEILNDIFESIHTVKGSSEYLGMERIAELSHKLENLLDMLRQGKRTVNREMIDLLIDARDRIGLLMEDLAQHESEQTDVSDLLERILALSANPSSEKKADVSEAEDNAVVEEPDPEPSATLPDIEVLDDDEDYDEEYDEELFGIFIQQFSENLSVIKANIARCSESGDVAELLDSCKINIEGLRSSANYMGYTRLSNIYENWQSEIRQAKEDALEGKSVSIEFMTAYLNKVLKRFPKVELPDVSAGETVDTSADQPADQAKVESEEGPEFESMAEAVSESFDLFDDEEPADTFVTDSKIPSDATETNEQLPGEESTSDELGSAERLTEADEPEPECSRSDKTRSDKTRGDDPADQEKTGAEVSAEDERASGIGDSDEIPSGDKEASPIDMAEIELLVDENKLMEKLGKAFDTAMDENTDAPSSTTKGDMENQLFTSSPQTDKMDDGRSEGMETDLDTPPPAEDASVSAPVESDSEDALLELQAEPDDYDEEPAAGEAVDAATADTASQTMYDMQDDAREPLDADGDDGDAESTAVEAQESNAEREEQPLSDDMPVSAEFEQDTPVEFIQEKETEETAAQAVEEPEQEQDGALRAEADELSADDSAPAPFDASSGEPKNEPVNLSAEENDTPPIESEDSSKTSVAGSTSKSEDASNQKSGHVQEPASKEPPDKEKATQRKPDLFGEKVTRQSLRVDAAKIDSLMNQVGELVVSRAWFSQLFNEMREFQQHLKEMAALEKNEMKRVRGLTFRLSEATMALGRVANELQEGVMKVRMLPISQLFNRYPRLVRDLVRDTDKMVRLDITGEDTELDKMIIEQISDPLIHIIRNAVDHGIESKTDRLKAKKPEDGTINLEAYHESNHVVIEIMDDGSGIDPERIKNTAIAKDLVPKDELDMMNRKELIGLIMKPGFSTAAKVTHTSGRGVGMDVVRKNVEKLNGTIEIDSTVGSGTQFRIKIPLTLAIIPALLVRVGAEDLFTIPLAAVEETLRIYDEDTSTIESVEVIHLRNRTLPLIRLSDIFNLKSIVAKGEKSFAVVVRTGVRRVGLVVDALIGQEEVVIKPLVDYLQENSGFSGATILGDGKISLILDVYELVKMSIDKHIDRRKSYSFIDSATRVKKSEKRKEAVPA